MDTDTDPRQAALRRLEPLVGAWGVTVGFDRSLRARSDFEWALGGQFLLQRTEVPHPDAPDSLTLVSVDDDDPECYTQHYFDSRGIPRLYAMTLRDGLWTLRREKPDFTPLEFSQRFEGRFEDDGRTIRGAWETSHDGGATWEHDFDLTYTRIAGG
jgi:hypothetical protein